MKSEEFFLHKLQSLIDQKIKTTFQDETGYYIQLSDGKWKKLSFVDTEKNIDQYIEQVDIQYINELYKKSFNFPQIQQPGSISFSDLGSTNPPDHPVSMITWIIRAFAAQCSGVS